MEGEVKRLEGEFPLEGEGEILERGARRLHCLTAHQKLFCNLRPGLRSNIISTSLEQRFPLTTLLSISERVCLMPGKMCI